VFYLLPLQDKSIGASENYDSLTEISSTANANVSGFVRKWRANRDEIHNFYVIEIMV
jgi:hypothetical protein